MITNRVTPYLLPIALILLICACSQSTHSSLPKEELMERLYAENPDSLAQILEDHIVPAALSEQEKADYGWWITRTHIKQGRNLVNDSIIHFTLDWYKAHPSPRLIQTYVMAARQVNWSRYHSDAQEELLFDAIDIATQQNDSVMLKEAYVNLLESYLIANKTEKAIDTAHKYITYNPTGRDSLVIFANLASQYMLLHQPDSMLKYVQKGLYVAKKLGITHWERDLSKMYIETLNISGQHKKALHELKKLEATYPNEHVLDNYEVVTHLNLGQLDSAQYYIDKLETTLQKYATTSNHETVQSRQHLYSMFRTAIRLKKGEPFNFGEMGIYSDMLMRTGLFNMAIDRERQYAQNKLVRNKLQLEIAQGKLRQRILWGSIVMLLIIGAIIYFYQRKLLMKERTIQKAKEELQLHILQMNENEATIHQNEELIHTLTSQLDESSEYKELHEEQLEELKQLSLENEKLKQKTHKLQEDIHQYSDLLLKNNKELNSYEKMLEQNAVLQDRERFLTSQLVDRIEILNQLKDHPHYIEESQWPEIIHAVNTLYNNFIGRLRINFPSLTEEDLRFCCLSKLKLPTSTIATLTAISPSSVTKRKQRIKEKIKQHPKSSIDKKKPLESYLWSY